MDILLTGASGAIGSAIARRLAKLKHTLHLTSREPSRLDSLINDCEREGATVHTYTLDLLDRKRCQNVVDQFFTQAEVPSGLICNAGDLGVLGGFLNLEMDLWIKSVEQNFLSHAIMIHAFGRQFRQAKRKSGSIIVLSGAGLGSAVRHANLSSYGVAKAAITYLTEALSIELAPFDITINAIAPGQVNSNITEQALKAGIERVGEYALAAQKCKETGGVPPELTADVVEFLLSPKARHVTGRLISARFDQERLTKETEAIANSAHLYRLRRIDEELFGVRS